MTVRPQGPSHAIGYADRHPDLVPDIDAAIWCDIVLAAMAGQEDISCLSADPTACTGTFAELLNWATAGNMPARHSPYASAATFTGSRRTGETA